MPYCNCIFTYTPCYLTFCIYLFSRKTSSVVTDKKYYLINYFSVQNNITQAYKKESSAALLCNSNIFYKMSKFSEPYKYAASYIF